MCVCTENDGVHRSEERLPPTYLLESAANGDPMHIVALLETEGRSSILRGACGRTRWGFASQRLSA